MYEYQLLIALSTSEVSEMRCELHESHTITSPQNISSRLIIVSAISSWVSYRSHEIAIRRNNRRLKHVKSLKVRIKKSVIVIIDWSRRSTKSIACRMPRNVRDS